MAMSGVKVSDGVADKFNQIKMKKDLRYVIFRIENKKEIVVDSEGGIEKTFEDFSEAIKGAGGPRYALVDIDYETEDGRPQNKLTFVYWCPDATAKVMEKMLYAGSKAAIQKAFPGIMKVVEANSDDELHWDEVLQKMRKI